MKTAKYYLALAAVGIFCSLLQADIQPAPDCDKPAVTAKADPALAGMDKLSVQINLAGNKPNKIGLSREKLQNKIEGELKDAGIKIIANPGENPGPSCLDRFPRLKIDIKLINSADSQQYFFSTYTSLSRMVRVKKNPSLLLIATVFDTGIVIKAVPEKEVSAAVTDSVEKQVESFIAAWTLASQLDLQPADVNNPAVAPCKQENLSAKQTTAEYEYVASKNGKVFHKSSCSAAKRIRPENLKDYHSRAEAIKAGKRPCKICKP